MRSLILILLLATATHAAGKGREAGDLILPPISAAKAESDSEPRQYAVPMKVAATPSSHGRWESLDDGGRRWLLTVTVPGATDVNLGFDRFELPPGASLTVLSPAHRMHRGPFGPEHNRPHGERWLAPLPGEEVVLQLDVPAGASAWDLRLGHVGAGFRDLFRLRPAGAAAKQLACNLDVVCSEGDAWRDEIRSTGIYSVGGGFLCTGTMIMDVPGTFTPWFITARHCGLTAALAPSVVVLWNFESAACGDLGGGPLTDTQSGATLRALEPQVDVILLELDDRPDPSFNVFYSGWDATGATPAASTGISHSNREEKTLNFNVDPLVSTPSCISAFSPPDTHWTVGDFEQGMAEAGSSGSGLWDPGSGDPYAPGDKRLVGFLSGGIPGCVGSNPGNGFFCYGKFSVAWDRGASAASRLVDWLDPDATGTRSVAGSDIDYDPPALTAILRSAPTSAVTNRDALVFEVRFSEGVNGVDAADFEVTGTTGLISSITANDERSFLVEVSGGDLAGLDGSVSLTVAPGVSIADPAGNPLSPAAPTISEAYTVQQFVAAPDRYVVFEGDLLGVAAAGGVLANDTSAEPPARRVLSFAAGLLPGAAADLPDGGRLILQEDGAFSFDTQRDFEGLAAEESSVVTVTYRATDGDAEAEAAIEIEVFGRDDVLLAQPDFLTVREDGVLMGNVLEDNGAGPDSGGEADEVLTVTSVGESEADGIGGAVLLEADGTLRFTPPPDAFGTARFSYEVTDGFLQATGEVVVEVQPVNDPPSFTADGLIGRTALSPRVQTLPGWATGIDPGVGEAQSLRFDTTVVADPGGVLAAVAVAAEGTLTFELTGAIGQALVEVVLIDDGGTAAGGLDRSPAFELRIGVTPAPQIDLVVAIDDDREQVGVTGTLRYHASIENRGPDDAPGAILTVDVSPLVRTTAVACEAMGGAVCPDDVTAGAAVDLPAGG
ncbi:MAG: Ig-like domain-containing protein, partial [Pseudomonadota bacterium]